MAIYRCISEKREWSVDPTNPPGNVLNLFHKAGKVSEIQGEIQFEADRFNLALPYKKLVSPSLLRLDERAANTPPDISLSNHCVFPNGRGNCRSAGESEPQQISYRLMWLQRVDDRVKKIKTRFHPDSSMTLKRSAWHRHSSLTSLRQWAALRKKKKLIDVKI